MTQLNLRKVQIYPNYFIYIMELDMNWSSGFLPAAQIMPHCNLILL